MEMSLIGFLSFLIIISVVNCHCRYEESMKKGERLKYPPLYVVCKEAHMHEECNSTCLTPSSRLRRQQQNYNLS